MVIQSQPGFDFTHFPAHSPFQAFQIASGTKWRALSRLSPLSERLVEPTHTAYKLKKEIMVLNIRNVQEMCYLCSS